MKSVKIFSFVFLTTFTSLFSRADALIPNPKGHSLKPVLTELKIALPLPKDLQHPFRYFASAPSTKIIAISLAKEAAPSNSQLLEKAIVVDVSDDAEIVAQISPLPRSGFADVRPGTMTFLDDRFLRIEFTARPSDDANGKRYLRTYNVYDIETKKQYAIEERLPFDQITNIQAVSNYHYLVRHVENKMKVNTLIYFNPLTSEFKILDKPSDEIAHGLRQAVSGTDSMVWKLDNDKIVVHFEANIAHENNFYTYLMDRENADYNPGHSGYLGDDEGMFVVHGDGDLVRIADESIYYASHGASFDENEPWQQPNEDYLSGPFYKMGDYLVAKFDQYPNFGWVLLPIKQGDIRYITDPQFDLMLYNVNGTDITGIGPYDSETEDLYYYALRVGILTGINNQIQTKPVLIKRQSAVEIVPLNEEAPVVSSVESERYLFVLLTPKILVIIDVENPNRILQKMDLLDEDYRILHVDEKTTLVHYPKLKKVLEYKRPTFQLENTMDESQCEHLLNPR